MHPAIVRNRRCALKAGDHRGRLGSIPVDWSLSRSIDGTRTAARRCSRSRPDRNVGRRRRPRADARHPARTPSVDAPRTCGSRTGASRQSRRRTADVVLLAGEGHPSRFRSAADLSVKTRAEIPQARLADRTGQPDVALDRRRQRCEMRLGQQRRIDGSREISRHIASVLRAKAGPAFRPQPEHDARLDQHRFERPPQRSGHLRPPAEADHQIRPAAGHADRAGELRP